MSESEVLAAAAAAVVAGVFGLWRFRAARDRETGRGARFVLWLAIASPVAFLLLAPEDRPRVFVRGPGGAFEALRVLSFAAAAAGVVGSLPGGPCRAWSAALLVLAASLVALLACVLRVL